MTSIPREASNPVDLELYGEQADWYYKRPDTKLEDIANGTFLCAAFLPDKDMDVMVKYRPLQEVNFFQAKQKNSKHLSINRMAISEKRIRKMKEIRHFNFPQSVFKDFVFDSEKILDLAFEKDKELAKIAKFVRDENDRAKTYEVFRTHY